MAKVTQKVAEKIASPTLQTELRAQIETFLIYDALLLDQWRLKEWSGLMREDSRYMVPSMDDPDGDYRTSLYLVSDDYGTLMSRVNQLEGRNAWIENPHSRTRRLITNVWVREETDGVISVTANFTVWRFQFKDTDTYVGRFEHKLVRGGEHGFQFKERKAILDHHALRPHGKLTVIL